MKLKERWPSKGLYGVVNVLEAIYQRMYSKFLDNTQGKAVVSSVYVASQLLARKRMHEIEGQKAWILHELRHEFWKAGGPV